MGMPSLRVASQEMELGLSQHNLFMSPGKGQRMDMLRQSEWILKGRVKPLPPADKWFSVDHQTPHEYNSVELQGCLKALFSEAC